MLFWIPTFVGMTIINRQACPHENRERLSYELADWQIYKLTKNQEEKI